MAHGLHRRKLEERAQHILLSQNRRVYHSRQSPVSAKDALNALLDIGLHYRHLKSNFEPGVLVLTITQPQVLDDVLSDGFEAELLAAVSHVATQKVALDFQNVNAVSPEAIKPLLHLRACLVERGGRLLLCGLSSVVAEMLRLSELVSGDQSPALAFDVRPDLAAAIADLSGTPEFAQAAEPRPVRER
jgi:anti-anti-sigma regulatory factor